MPQTRLKGAGRSRFRKPSSAPWGKKLFSRRREPSSSRIDLPATISRAWCRGIARPESVDMVSPAYIAPRARLLMVLLDVSDSMAPALEATRVWLQEAMRTSYFRRDPVVIISVQGDRAQILNYPTTSLGLILNRLGEIRVGGGTPLDHGLIQVRRVIMQIRDRYPVLDLVLLTDGKSTSPLTGPAVRRAVSAIRKHVHTVTVVNPKQEAGEALRALVGLLGGKLVSPGSVDDALGAGCPA